MCVSTLTTAFSKLYVWETGGHLTITLLNSLYMKMKLLVCMLAFAYIKANGKGYALLVGTNKIAAGAYSATYSEAAIKGVPTDVNRMAEIMTMAGFEDIRTLLGQSATKENILTHLNDIRSKISKEDIFVFYYSGHGDTLRDANKDELPYLFDQAFVTYNKYLVDDELNVVWKSFPKGVKIYQMIDACFSGEMFFKVENLSRKFKASFKTESLSLNKGVCSGLDGTQPFNMYSISSATKDRTSTPFSNGEGIMTNDVYTLYKKFDKENKLKNMTAVEFFEAVCSGTTGFAFIRIYPTVDPFAKDYVFKLK
jgi:hypothetical protein